MSKRRTNSQKGLVNFPVDSPEYKSTREGGMFVHLIVVDMNSYQDKWVVCCGGEDIQVVMGNDLIGTDTGKSRDEAENFFFPRLNSPDYSPPEDVETRYTSVPLLAAITIGSTGWSGWSEEQGKYWTCTRNDLTEEGEKLYQILESTYSGCGIYLVTWLDT